MNLKFGKKTMLMVVLVFLGILLFMHFRNPIREGLRPILDAKGKRDLTDCKKAGGTWKDKNGKGDWKCE